MAKVKLNNGRFARWVRAYGVARLARTLGVVDRAAVQKWIKAEPRYKPSRLNSKRIVQLSQTEPKEIGPLTLEDLL